MDTFLLPPAFDYGATLLWAVSGALLAARQGYDVIGMGMMALVSSTGGGLLRDGLFLQDGPPLLVESPVYLALVAVGTLLVLVFGRYLRRMPFDKLVNLVDALGLGAYAVVGMNRASALGLSLLGVILVGMVNAVGGAVLRSVLIAREPALFRPGTLMAVAALIGCVVFVTLKGPLGVDQTRAAWITIAIVFTIRALSLRYHIETKPLAGFSDEWKSGGSAP